MVRKSCLGTASGCMSQLKCDVHIWRAPFGWYWSPTVAIVELARKLS